MVMNLDFSLLPRGRMGNSKFSLKKSWPWDDLEMTLNIRNGVNTQSTKRITLEMESFLWAMKNKKRIVKIHPIIKKLWTGQGIGHILYRNV